MTLVRLCPRCPAFVSRAGLCPDCKRAENRKRRQRKGSTAQRGYGAEWQELAKQAIRRQPWCSVEGCGDTDLTVDHRDPATRGQRGLTLDDVLVLCRSHNSSKGDSGFLTERPMTPSLALREKQSQIDRPGGVNIG